MIKLWVDFNNMGHDGVRLICNGTLYELNKKSIVLKDGLRVIIWDNDEDDSGKADNLAVDAVVKFSDIDKCWVAQFDKNNLKHESERDAENKLL